MGLLLEAVGVEGIGLTVTLAVAAALVHPLTVTVTEYVPAIADVEPDIEGLGADDVKPFGPVHE